MLLGCAVNDCFALRIKFVGSGDQVQKGHHAANLTMQPIGSCTQLVPVVLGMHWSILVTAHPVESHSQCTANWATVNSLWYKKITMQAIESHSQLGHTSTAHAMHSQLTLPVVPIVHESPLCNSYTTWYFRYFSKKNLVDTCSFSGPLIPLFRSSGNVSSGFKSQSGQPYLHLVEEYVIYIPWNSPLV